MKNIRIYVLVYSDKDFMIRTEMKTVNRRRMPKITSLINIGEAVAGRVGYNLRISSVEM